ncbi:uncharacterized protein [Nicotiana tomentosiformis]|uniref:uncharacterized protein n=1 Tax=Nicotiana tomentosiformis TaxID=4098 RepID=UPI00388CB9AB
MIIKPTNKSVFLETVVYVKCKSHMRETLWEDLRGIANNINLPWLVVGDFNCVLAPEEKKGGKPHSMTKSITFLNCIMDSSLIDAEFISSTYTWCNGRSKRNRVWGRLDRALLNNEWSQRFTDTIVTHLVRIGSDHSPLLITIATSQINIQSYFRFLDFFIQQPDFMDIVKQAWSEEVYESPLWRFHLKFKNTCKKLSWWSKKYVGNIFENTAKMEIRVAELEEKCLNDNSDRNRMSYNNANAHLIMHIKKEEAFL